MTATFHTRRPQDCPGNPCANRRRSHSNCAPRRCIGEQCSNTTGLYCHAHDHHCSPSTCSCRPRECVDTTGIDPKGLYCHVHRAFCDTPHCACGQNTDTRPPRQAAPCC